MAHGGLHGPPFGAIRVLAAYAELNDGDLDGRAFWAGLPHPRTLPARRWANAIYSRYLDDYGLLVEEAGGISRHTLREALDKAFSEDVDSPAKPAAVDMSAFD